MSEFLSSALNDNHVLSEFSCGIEVLDNWLKLQALRAQKAGVATTTVWRQRANPNQVVAYFAIAPTLATKGALTRRLSAGYSVIPGWLLVRLAVDNAFQGKGVGQQLLHDAISRIVAAAEIGAGRLIVVDPINDTVVDWYSKAGFATTEGPDRRMYLTISDARNAIRADFAPPKPSPTSRKWDGGLPDG